MLLLENLQVYSLVSSLRFIQVKEYVSYLLAHQLDDLARELIKEMQEANYPPLLTLIEVEKEHLEEAIKNNLHLFLQSMLGEQPVPNTDGQDPGYITSLLRTNHLLNVVDITRLYSYNKKILISYILKYTKDCDIIIEVSLALEDVFRELLAHTLTQYIGEATGDSNSNSKYSEYLTTIAELEESREVLRSYVDALKSRQLLLGPSTETSRNTLNRLVESNKNLDTSHSAYPFWPEDNKTILYSMLDEFPEKTCMVTPAGDFIYFNNLYHQYTGLGKKEALEQGWQAVLPDTELRQTKIKWDNCLTNGTVFKQRVRLKQAFINKYRLHLGRAFPLKSKDGHIYVWIGIFTDMHCYKLAVNKITIFRKNLKRKRKALIKARADLESFIYVASHDLKAPLANIQGLMTLLKNHESDLSEEKQRIFSMIDQSSDKLADILNELTQITQIHHRQAGEREYINFSEVVKELLSELQVQFSELQAVEVKSEFLVSSIFYWKEDLYTILRQLLTNALKFRSVLRPLKLTLGSYEKDRYILFTITDNGLGLNITQQHKLFQMFKKLHAHESGAGNGLYITKELVEKHGGKIDFQSEENKGTTFEIFLTKI